MKYGIYRIVWVDSANRSRDKCALEYGGATGVMKVEDNKIRPDAFFFFCSGQCINAFNFHGSNLAVIKYGWRLKLG